jgi:hypothetical protein
LLHGLKLQTQLFANAVLICPTVASGANQTSNFVMIIPSSISSAAAGVGAMFVMASSAGALASPGSAGLYELDEVEAFDTLEKLEEIDDNPIELASVDAGVEVVVCNELLADVLILDELVFVEPPPQPCSATAVAITIMNCFSMILFQTLR